MAKEFYELVRSYGGVSLEYAKIEESDFSATAGSAYSPPEENADYRRIAGDRQIQLLGSCPGVVETFQTASGEIFLPANTVAQDTNDAGDGRIFFMKNSGSGSIEIKDYQGNGLHVLESGFCILTLGNDANTWDFCFVADNTAFDNSITQWDLSKNSVQKAIEHVYYNAISARFTLTLIHNGKCFNNEWITYSDLTPDVWIQFPVACKIQEFTWTNKLTNRDFDLEFFKNTVPGGLYKTYSVTNDEYGFENNWEDSFSAGDRLRISYKDQGDNAEDLVLVLYCYIT